MTVSLETVVMVLGLIVNFGAIVGYSTRLEHRLTKVETFLRVKWDSEHNLD